MTIGTEPVVVVGGGQGGFQTAVSLREHGFTGDLTLVCDEPGLPYQRPPLSKAYLAAAPDDAVVLTLRPKSFFTRHDIDVVQDPAVRLDRAARHVVLRSGQALPYGHLVLATGARARRIPLPGADLDGVQCLRTRADADALRPLLAPGRSVVVVGGGFIGMEVAGAARKQGAAATVVEALDRVMARAAAPEISAHVQEVHTAEGTTILLNRVVRQIESNLDGGGCALVLDDGSRLPADAVVIGVGVLPNVDLAAEAGLAVADGIVVDERLLTGDPAISAIGDCAVYPNVHAGVRTRLESVQNATDQARFVAERLVSGSARTYADVPWFWTHQFDMRIQMAGIGRAGDHTVVRGEPGSGRFSVFRFDADRLVAVESVNRTVDHIAARKVLAGHMLPSPDEVAEPEFELRQFVAGVPTG